MFTAGSCRRNSKHRGYSAVPKVAFYLSKKRNRKRQNFDFGWFYCRITGRQGKCHGSYEYGRLQGKNNGSAWSEHLQKAKARFNTLRKTKQLTKESSLKLNIKMQIYKTDPLSPRLYGLPNIHKTNVFLKPIVSSIGSLHFCEKIHGICRVNRQHYITLLTLLYCRLRLHTCKFWRSFAVYHDASWKTSRSVEWNLPQEHS